MKVKLISLEIKLAKNSNKSEEIALIHRTSQRNVQETHPHSLFTDLLKQLQHRQLFDIL